MKPKPKPKGSAAFSLCLEKLRTHCQVINTVISHSHFTGDQVQKHEATRVSRYSWSTIRRNSLSVQMSDTPDQSLVSPSTDSQSKTPILLLTNRTGTLPPWSCSTKCQANSCTSPSEIRPTAHPNQAPHTPPAQHDLAGSHPYAREREGTRTGAPEKHGWRR